MPSGASKGEHEALELRDGDPARFGGKGVLKAIENIHERLLPAVLGMDPTDQDAVDQALIAADGTEGKTALGPTSVHYVK